MFPSLKLNKLSLTMSRKINKPQFGIKNALVIVKIVLFQFFNIFDKRASLLKTIEISSQTSVAKK